MSTSSKVIRKTFQYRIYPSKSQVKKLEKTLEACCFVYNTILQRRIDSWNEQKKRLSRYDTINMLPSLKEEYPHLKEIYSRALQDVCNRVDLAFKGFFRRLKAKKGKAGFPRFKDKENYNSFTYIRDGFKLDKTGAGKYKRLQLSKIGKIKIVLHRDVQGKIKTLTIKRTPTGKWYACFSCEVESNPLPPSSKVVGIDMGLESFATFSTGEKIDNPRFFEEEEKALAKAQRKLSQTEKGAPEWKRRRKVVARIHERISNKRRDFAHKLSRRLVDEFQVIVFEKLDIEEMRRKKKGNWRNIRKGIGDAAWRQFQQFTAYKAEEAGRLYVEVAPRNTTQLCSGCGAIVSKDLKKRIHECPHCGLTLDRDHNAARNILALGLQSLDVSPKSPAPKSGE